MVVTPKRLGVVAATAAVAALVLGSVQSTGALWRDAASSDAGAVNTGTLSISTGAGSNPNYTFDALSGANQVLTQFVQAPLLITNTGNIALKYHLVSAGPTVSTASTVAVTLQGAVGGTCTGTSALGPTPAFSQLTGVTAATAATSAYRTLAPAASETWCIRTTLVAVSGTQPAHYKHLFTFRAEQAKHT